MSHVYPIKRKRGPGRRGLCREVKMLVDRFGTNAAFSEATGLSLDTVKGIIRRNLIPAQHWPDIMAACRSAGFAEVDVDYLLGIYLAGFQRSHPDLYPPPTLPPPASPENANHPEVLG